MGLFCIKAYYIWQYVMYTIKKRNVINYKTGCGIYYVNRGETTWKIL